MNDLLLDRIDLRAPVRLLALALFSALLLSTAGAFDTEAARFWPRLGYWVVIALISTVALEAAQRALRPRMDGALDWQVRAAGWLLLVLPLTALATVGCKLLFGGWPSIGGFTKLLPGMSAILAALQFVLSLFVTAAPAAAAAAEEPRLDALAELLPLPLRAARIDALQAEDHYVRVHSSAGQMLIRIRFADALEAVAERRGVRPHRSWWVAEESVAAMSRAQGRTVLRLVSGVEVPVSRRARPLLGPLFERGSQ